MSKLPKTIAIGPYIYDVEIKDPKGDRVGEIHYRRARIRIHPNMHTNRKRETLLHEVMHGVINAAGSKYALAENSDEGEALVQAIVPTLLDTLRRNPSLAAYLLDGAK